jgi:hypothetical protein
MHHLGWCYSRWLRGMPFSFSGIELRRQGALKHPLPDGMLQPPLPARRAESDQGFFALIARSA